MTVDELPRTVVLLPTYNECQSISKVLDSVFMFAPLVNVFVVDDSSPDGTGIAVRDHERFDNGLQLLSPSRRSGLGDAHREAMAWALGAGYERIVQMDADGSHRAAELPRLLDVCSTPDVLVVGSRWVSGGRTENWSFIRRMISRDGNRFAQMVLRCELPDMTSGYRVWGHEALRCTLAHEGKSMTGYGFQIEMAWSHWRRGGQVRNVPICFVERTEGSSKMSFRIALEAACGVIYLRLKEIRRD